jgi:hypothetical protein
MSYDIHLNIPENSPAGQIVQRLVIMEHVTPDQAAFRILTEAGRQESKPAPTAKTTDLDEAMARVRAEHPTYASFFGAAKGQPGAHRSPEAADRYIEELRNAW